MSDWKVISTKTHASKRWQRPNGLLHASTDTLVPIVAQEAPTAMMSMPLAFMEHQGKYQPVAVQGLKQGENKFVSPEGRWLGEYIPVAYRVYPFRLIRSAEGHDALCIDESAVRVTEGGEGEPFLTSDNKPAPLVASVLVMLGQLERQRAATEAICARLMNHDLFEPWNLQIRDGDEVVDVSGLHRIAELKLYKVSGPTLVELRDSGALTLAYAQLFSMQQIHQMTRLTGLRKVPAETAAPVVKIDTDSGLITFENL